jgi:adenylate cyclase
VLAQVQLTRRNLDRSLWHQERALSLNPNDDRILCAHGEILTALGRAGEGLAWVRKAMRLNPYHPQRYWTHRAHALVHLERYEEALAALSNISRLRLDDRVYAAVANHMLGDGDRAAECLVALHREFPEFNANAFVESLPYTDRSYRQAIAEPLEEALAEEYARQREVQ